MEKQEYEDGTVPQHVANFFRMQRKEQVSRIIEQEWRKSMDDDEMEEIEPGQNVGIYNFLR